MTRKDYIALAEALSVARVQVDVVTNMKRYAAQPAVTLAFDHATHRIADVLAMDNPRFDRTRFIAACQGGK